MQSCRAPPFGNPRTHALFRARPERSRLGPGRDDRHRLRRATILFANRQVTALFGYANDEIVGGAVEVLLPERFRARHTAHRDSYTRNVRVRPMGMGLELFGRRKDGSEFPVEISLSPIRQGDEDIVAAAIRDVTERRQVEQARARRAPRSRTRHARQEPLSRHREPRSASAAADARPAERRPAPHGPRRRNASRCCGEQEQAVDAMSRLLNALLDISKLESGVDQARPHRLRPGAAVRRAAPRFLGAGREQGTARWPSIPRRCTCIPIRRWSSQVLRNLLSNAIKYTQSGSVELRCEHRGERLRIEVRDTRCGHRARAPRHRSSKSSTRSAFRPTARATVTDWA